MIKSPQAPNTVGRADGSALSCVPPLTAITLADRNI